MTLLDNEYNLSLMRQFHSANGPLKLYAFLNVMDLPTNTLVSGDLALLTFITIKACYSCISADVDYANCSSDLATTVRTTLKQGSKICFTSGNAAACITIQWCIDEMITVHNISYVGASNISEITAAYKCLLMSVVVVRMITFPIFATYWLLLIN